jgi:hypothetical protein
VAGTQRQGNRAGFAAEACRVSHPFEEMPRSTLPIVFVALALITLAVGRAIAAPLRTEAAPLGIVSLEFAGSANKAQNILDSWTAGQKYAALRNTRLDYVFLVCYSTLLAVGCVWASGGFEEDWRHVGGWLAWAQWGAGALDAVENVGLFYLLRGSVEDRWTRLALGCAVPKFLLIVAGIAYVLTGLVVALSR